MDISATKIYHGIENTNYNKIEQIVTKNKIYHHDFIINGSTGLIKYDLEAENYEIYTNSLGFRDKSCRVIPLSGQNKRILFIGDSFTEGVLLNYHDTFVGIIETFLRDKGIEILNAGRSSYSPIIYWRKIKYLIEEVGLKFEEVVVYIDISDAQDESLGYELSEDQTVKRRKGRDGKESLYNYIKG